MTAKYKVFILFNVIYNKENKGKEQSDHEEEKAAEGKIQLAADVASEVSADDVRAVFGMAGYL